jgi:hypothetical protein
VTDHRTVEVVTSAHAEAWGVARALFHVVFWSALVVSAETHRPTAAGGVSAAQGSPFERRFQDLSSLDQRSYRSIQEGVVEAESIRAATGRWPSVEVLARAGVPPFAPDPIDHAGYLWRFVETGPRANYIGTPTQGSGRDAFFVVIVEPEPGTPDDPLVQPDEVHHRLRRGPMIHVTVWMGPPLAETGEAVALLPPERGYRQVVGAAPSR